MDFLGADEDDVISRDLLLSSALFAELLKLRLNSKVALSGEELLLPKHLCVIANDDTMSTCQNLIEKLHSVKFDHVEVLTMENSLAAPEEFDIVLCLWEPEAIMGTANRFIEFLDERIHPSGHLLLSCPATMMLIKSWSFMFIKVTSISSDVEVWRKRSVMCNIGAAPYWCGDVAQDTASARLTAELNLLELISVPISMSEKQLGVLSDASHQRAVDNLLKHGVCIFPGIFDRDSVMSWGEKSRADMKTILQKLSFKGINILNPTAAENPFINNFFELSMREALRCDVRNGPQLKEKSRAVYDYASAVRQAIVVSAKGVHCSSRDAELNIDRIDADIADANSNPSNDLPSYHRSFKYFRSAWGGTIASPLDKPPIVNESEIASNNSSAWGDIFARMPPTSNIRYNPAIMAVVSEAMNPRASVAGVEMGNWGRWNFEGPGPSAASTFCVGDVGTVMSLPGCAGMRSE
jgi:hypothetical protein